MSHGSKKPAIIARARANPQATNGELAAETGASVNYIAIVRRMAKVSRGRRGRRPKYINGRER